MKNNDRAEHQKKEWAKRFASLVGRSITAVSWMNESEVKATGWHRSAIVIQLDDGTLLIPQMDDEGNDAGALYVQAGSKTKGIETVAPVI
jgi:hypothetical protein